MGAGSNYGLLLNATDYANARVPLMFFANDSGIVYSSFNAFTNSPRKYRVDIAGWNHHVGGYETSWCQDIHNSYSHRMGPFENRSVGQVGSSRSPR